MSSARKHDLDNIRWAAVLLVVVYHVFYMFNACGVAGGVGSFSSTQVQDAFLPFVYPWFMVLLFVVAGISARHALERKTAKEFIKARSVKLLVPSTLGLFVYQWLVGWFYMWSGGGMDALSQVPVPVLYLIAALSGIGPLWFAQLLWLYSLLLVLIRGLDRRDQLYALCGKAGPLVCVPLALLLWCGAQVGNMPVVITYRLGIYLVAFFAGYFFLSQERTREQLAKFHLPLLAAALLMGLAYTTRYFGQDYTASACLRGWFTNLYAWFMTLAVLGCAKAWFDTETPFTRYMNKAGFGIYVLHYLPLLLAAWFLKTRTAFPAAVIYPLCAAAGLLGGLALWELFRRIPILRFAVLGVQKKEQRPDNTIKSPHTLP